MGNAGFISSTGLYPADYNAIKPITLQPYSLLRPPVVTSMLLLQNGQVHMCLGVAAHEAIVHRACRASRFELQLMNSLINDRKSLRLGFRHRNEKQSTYYKY